MSSQIRLPAPVRFRANSVASFAEIRRGIELMLAGRRRERLGAWLTEEPQANLNEFYGMSLLIAFTTSADETRGDTLSA